MAKVNSTDRYEAYLRWQRKGRPDGVESKGAEEVRAPKTPLKNIIAAQAATLGLLTSGRRVNAVLKEMARIAEGMESISEIVESLRGDFRREMGSEEVFRGPPPIELQLVRNIFTAEIVELKWMVDVPSAKFAGMIVSPECGEKTLCDGEATAAFASAEDGSSVQLDTVVDQVILSTIRFIRPVGR